MECLSVNPVALIINSEVSLWRYNLLENIENTIEQDEQNEHAFIPGVKAQARP